MRKAQIPMMELIQGLLFQLCHEVSQWRFLERKAGFIQYTEVTSPKWTLERYPRKYRLGSPIYCYSLALCLVWVVSGCAGQGETSSQLEIGKPVFYNATLDAGLGDFKHETGGFGQSLMPEIVGGGGGFIDYNGDGWGRYHPGCRR